MATHSSILAWRIPWTEEPGRLQSVGLQRVRHSCLTEHKQKDISGRDFLKDFLMWIIFFNNPHFKIIH